MKKTFLVVVSVLAAALIALPVAAIEVTAGGWRNADASVGENVQTADDIIVKPCDCDAVPNPGNFRAFRDNGTLVTIHYSVLEGTTITTTDGTVVGTISSVQNERDNGPIVLLVRIEAGLIGTVDLISVYRNAWYWTGEAAVIDTTMDDLRASILGAGVGA